MRLKRLKKGMMYQIQIHQRCVTGREHFPRLSRLDPYELFEPYAAMPCFEFAIRAIRACPPQPWRRRGSVVKNPG